jgi:polysaccharide export outer membrane protein
MALDREGRMKERIYLIFLMAVLIFPSGCATNNIKKSLESGEDSVITGIDVQDYTVTITVNKPFIYNIYRPNDPYKMVIELPAVSTGAFNNKIIPDKAGIAEIVPTQIKSPYFMAKIEVLFQALSMATPEDKDNTLIIRIKKLQPPPPVSSDASANQSYMIGDEDVLQISVWGNPELTVQVPVRPDGMISVPLAGDVRAAGLTPQELKALLEKELIKYVKAPTVSVVVTAVNSFKVFVLGEGVSGATTSGGITLRRNTTLLQLFAQLGSLQNANLNNSFVLRNGQKLNVDLYKLVVKGDITQDLQIRPNDIIFIPDNFEKRIMVIGAVKTPGVIQYKEGMTVLDAILSAGGFTEFAKQNGVIVVRKEGNEVRNIEVELKAAIKEGKISKDLPLKPGDRIIVKTGIF